jgi:hypothetical protein
MLSPPRLPEFQRRAIESSGVSSGPVAEFAKDLLVRVEVVQLRLRRA